VTTGPDSEELFDRLLLYVQPAEDFAARWTTVVGEVERRRQLMGLEAAVASVCDDLAAKRL
jgi:hypothetical protein